MMSTYRRLGIAPLAAVLTLALGCGDDGPSGAPFSVSIVAPEQGATAYQGRPVGFEAQVQARSGDVLDPNDFAFEWDFGDGAATTGSGPSVDHVYASDGTVLVSVTASSDAGTADDQTDVQILPLSDLTVDEATATTSDAIVRSGEAFRLSGNLVSEAGAVPVAFDVGFYVIPAAAAAGVTSLDADGLSQLRVNAGAIELTRLGLDDIGARPAQAVVDNASLRFPDDAPSGEYVAFLFADPDDAVAEVDETNNAAFAARVITFENSVGDGPDLVVSAVDARPSVVNTLASLRVSATISNAGNTLADPFDYAIYLSADDANLSDDDLLLSSGGVSGLAAADSIRFSDLDVDIAPPITEVGDYFVVFVADSAGAVAETNEDNNDAASGRVRVTDETLPGADIVPTAFSAVPNTTFVGGSVRFSLTVENQGVEAVEQQFNCKFYFSEDNRFDEAVDPLIQTALIPPLGIGASDTQTIDAFVPPIDEGVYVPIVACDPSLLVPESDNDNNVRAADQDVRVAADAVVDLRAENVSVTPASIANGGDVSVTVDVCNDGSTQSTPSVVRVFMSEDPTLDAADTILLESGVPVVEALSCVTVRAEVPAICDTFVSRYTVFAAVDVTNLVTEVDETNNVGQQAAPFEITGIVCACELDALEPNDTTGNAAFLNPAVPSYPDLTMCASNVDYYQIPLLEDDTVRVAIDFEHARGDLDMTLFALDGATVLSESATRGDREEVSFIRVPERGNYLLRVQGREVGERNVYDMSLEVSAPIAGTDIIVLDVAVDDPRPVLGDVVEVCFDVVNLGDVAAEASVARVFLSADTRLDPLVDVRAADVDIPAFDSRVRACADVTIPGDLGGGPAYVLVDGDARDDVPGELSEDNNLGVSPVFDIDAACFDVLEPNNALEAPRRLDLVGAPPIVVSEVSVCSNNRDFYELCVDEGDFLEVRVAFDTADGDVDMKLWSGGVEVTRSEGVGGTEEVAVDYVTADRCYVAELYVAGADREVPYTLTIDTGRAPDELACSRGEEPNEGFAEARPLRDHLDGEIAICPEGDADYYWVDLTEFTAFEVRLESPDGSAPAAALRTTLWGPAANFLEATVSATEPLTHDVAVGGRHYLRVSSVGDGARNMPYRLVVEGLSGTDLVPLDFVLTPAQASAGETVRFSFTASNTRDVASPVTDYSVTLSEDPVLSADDTLLRTLPLNALEGLASRAEGRRFDVPAGLIDGGSYFVLLELDPSDRVDEFSDSNNLAAAPLSITPLCLPDEAEPNNFPIDARPLDETAGAFTSCGSADTDWFSFEGAGRAEVVSLTFFDADGDLNLAVYRDDAGVLTPVGVSDSITDNESVGVTTTDATYLIEVTQFTDRSAPYTLSVE